MTIPNDIPVHPVRSGSVYFVGAGPGSPDLLTVRAARILGKASRVVYAGSLVPEEFMHALAPEARWVDSAGLTREEIVDSLVEGANRGEVVVRLASGDPAIFGAMAEMTTELDKQGISWEVVPGVSSVFASAAALGRDLTLPEVSQTVILTRTAGRTPMPEGEEIESLARHGSTLVIFLSIDRIEELVERLTSVLPEKTPAAVVARASWPDEILIQGDLSTIAVMVRAAKIYRQALMIVGKALDPELRKSARSRLYAADFGHGFRDPSGGGTPSESAGS
ncbi:MAG: Precorrin-4 C11-methyltransferase [Leptospirillum sp. Group II 'C75']|uniref:Precorrin-4 C(11)-methyltransferase n=1 Tax=Leptospirillum ferriphilum TaxID=178606 RepID=A0A1V3SUJ4_9BACT|nr:MULTISPECIES: precorrin-4 C(11)-methyltransferase [Leptospirillum]AKS23340.1 cobalt-precorrin-4 C(11)-methyltransferase [Leptospirillum sp. Group II 'CF-1']EAY55858.1 MAG: Precorrin-4 C11-methyltransferase [Leptospirillum rubarum]EIJ76236.1 MAG: Precorrin-4 C11-methyltransferase [Leptospirillum sp. Group II 'C75']OOH70841.1 precorrin-4 C(11)-methyltransferase [Leptospirillum ferriphilum]